LPARPEHRPAHEGNLSDYAMIYLLESGGQGFLIVAKTSAEAKAKFAKMRNPVPAFHWEPKPKRVKATKP
jgi:hypothetical protein